MEHRKNKKIVIVITLLLVVGVIGISFSYFTASTTRNNLTNSTVDTTVTIDNTEFIIEGKLAINDLNILPGHKSVSSIKVTARGDHTINYNLIWDGINSLERLDYKVYKTNTEIVPTTTCRRITEEDQGLTKYYEECNITNITELGEVISNGSINKNTEITKEILKSNETITATKEGETVYYYVVLEFPNLDKDQNIDMNSKFEGEITVESSEVEYNKPSVRIKNSDSTENTITLNVEGIKASREIDKYFYKVNDGEYQETRNSNIVINQLNQNTEYTISIYCIDRGGNRSEEINTKIKTKEILTMAQILDKYTKSTSRTGQITAPFTGNTPTTVYSKEDDAGTSYMFAGVNPNNWVKLGNLYFRIVRFNGDGSLRLIYSGEGSPATSGEGTQIGTKAFNSSFYDNMYVGLQYTSGQVHGTETNSTILGTSTSTDLTTLYGWYNNKVKPSYSSLIESNAGFCSDRDNYTDKNGTTSGGGTGTTITYYGGYIRYVKGGSDQPTYIPTLKCKNASDNLKLPVGLITADEYALAGGGENISGYINTAFWLHTGQDYWTMSPSYYLGGAYVFYLSSSGYFNSNNTSAAFGVRPAINLKSTTKFINNGTGPTGSITNPYEVVIS